MERRQSTGGGASPFHAGEQAVQRRLGVRDEIEPWARKVVRTCLPAQHRSFYARLPFVVAAARDDAGQPWVTLLSGPPGFVRAPDPETLELAARAPPGDALAGSLVAGAELGLLGIDLETRRRNRVNGRIAASTADGLRLEVGQSFGNCPQYITERAWRRVRVRAEKASVARYSRLDAALRAWIRKADTFFIASGYRSAGDSEIYGMDASHRGGAPGFVEIESETRLLFPDFAGNNHFNTIGNLVMDPRVGLLFVDFERGSLLQLTGTATIDWSSDRVAGYPGAKRLVTIDIARIVRLDSVLPLRWSEPKGSIRSLRVVEKTLESEDVTSFVFVARDGGELPDFEAGQHLPLELPIDGHEKRMKRTYSLSNGPGEGRYRISVKREPLGLVSRHLHDAVEVGEIVSSSKPDGEFVLRPGHRPVVLISAGIGVTPMVSMLHALHKESVNRRVLFVNGARDGAHHPLAAEVRQLIGQRPEMGLTVAYSRPRAEDVPGRDYDRRGRLDGELIESLLPSLEADFYLCGPIRFLSDLTSDLEARGAPQERVNVETFGPAA